MAVLGLILLAAAGVLTAAVVTSNTDSLSVSLWSVHVSNVTLGVVFVAGMITTVLAVVGLGLLMGALRRNRRLRKERRSLQRENEQLAQQRMDTDSTPMAPTGPLGSTSRRNEPFVDQQRYPDRQFDDDRTRVQQPVRVGSGYREPVAEPDATNRRRGPFARRRDGQTTTETGSPNA